MWYSFSARMNTLQSPTSPLKPDTRIDEQDDDGSAYIAYSSEDNSVMHVARLTANYTDVQPTYRRILVQLKREAPAIFKHGRYYLMLTSGCTGWAPNRAEVFYAESVPPLERNKTPPARLFPNLP